MDDDKFKMAQQIGVFVLIPFTLAIPPIVGWAIGKWLDEYFDTSPYLMYTCLFFGVLGGIRECYRIIKQFGNNE